MIPSDKEVAISSMLDDFVNMIRTRDDTLTDILWGDGEFILVGSERNEICRTRAELAAKLNRIFKQPATLVLDFPNRRIRVAGVVAWLFAEGVLARHSPDGTVQSRPYLASCIFEHVGGVWRWRQFFGSEPY